MMKGNDRRKNEKRKGKEVLRTSEKKKKDDN